MQETTQDLILTELRELRADVNRNSRDTGERLARLETNMTTLVGNGQPGRITLLEQAVTKLQQWRWKLAGVAAAVSCVVSFIAWLIKG